MPGNLLEKRREKLVKMDLPFSCHFDLTYHCNLNCIHCYTVEQTRMELNTDEIKGILSQLAEAGTLYLQFSGGEILLRDDFFEIAEYARKLRFALILNSNGILIDEEMADKIANINPYKVSISIYSTDPQVHDGITGLPGSLEKSIEAVKLLKERGLWVNITNVLMKQNIDDYKKVYQLSKELGVKCTLDPNITPKIDGDDSPVKFKIGIKDLFKLNTDPSIKLESEQDASLSTEEMHDLSSFADDYPCTAAHSFFHITPYGDVFPCPMLSFSCGNLKENSFNEIWNHSSKMIEARSIRWNDIPDCAKCEDKKYCNYCPGLAYLKTGNMLSSYPSACIEAEMKRKIENITVKFKFTTI